MQDPVEADLLSVEMSRLCFSSTVYYCLFPQDNFSENSRLKVSAVCLWFQQALQVLYPPVFVAFEAISTKDLFLQGCSKTSIGCSYYGT